MMPRPPASVTAFASAPSDAVPMGARRIGWLMPSFSVSLVRSGIEIVPSNSSFALDAVDRQLSDRYRPYTQDDSSDVVNTPIVQQNNARSSHQCQQRVVARVTRASRRGDRRCLGDDGRIGRSKEIRSLACPVALHARPYAGNPARSLRLPVGCRPRWGAPRWLGIIHVAFAMYAARPLHPGR
jgi:hypothetical protein